MAGERKVARAGLRNHGQTFAEEIGVRVRRWSTARKLDGSTWEQRVRVLNEAGYTRYQERTATMLGDTAAAALERYGGDLRRVRDEAERDPRAERRALQQFKGVGA